MLDRFVELPRPKALYVLSHVGLQLSMVIGCLNTMIPMLGGDSFCGIRHFLSFFVLATLIALCSMYVHISRSSLLALYCCIMQDFHFSCYFYTVFLNSHCALHYTLE